VRGRRAFFFALRAFFALRGRLFFLGFAFRRALLFRLRLATSGTPVTLPVSSLMTTPARPWVLMKTKFSSSGLRFLRLAAIRLAPFTFCPLTSLKRIRPPGAGLEKR
jgi:hypothetical protein